MAFTTDKVKLTLSLDSDTDTALRVLSAKHRGSNLSSIVEDMFEHCKGNKAFLSKIEAKYSPKKEEEIDY
jgi:hypothetical protein